MQGPQSAKGIGRVEIFHRGQWGTICNDYGWGISEAKVVCRQLGYAYTLKTLLGIDVPKGTGKIWLSGVRCLGYEQNVTNCDHDGFGNAKCGHNEEVGVECSSTGKNIMKSICPSQLRYKYT